MISNELLPINVAGEWRLGGGDVYESLYPANGEPIARLKAASLADVEEAITRAHHAFKTSGWAQKLPHERASVLHRVAAMASGGMDTLPHNGAVITLLAVSGLTHRQAYADIFAITCLKTIAVFVVIAVYLLFGLY